MTLVQYHFFNNHYIYSSRKKSNNINIADANADAGKPVSVEKRRNSVNNHKADLSDNRDMETKRSLRKRRDKSDNDFVYHTTKQKRKNQTSGACFCFI